MPAVHFTVRWPDGVEEECYSPSSIITKYFEQSKPYDLEEFQTLARKALTAASERVRIVHGFPCSSAKAQLASLEHQIENLKNNPDVTNAFVTVVAYSA